MIAFHRGAGWLDKCGTHVGIGVLVPKMIVSLTHPPCLRDGWSDRGEEGVSRWLLGQPTAHLLASFTHERPSLALL